MISKWIALLVITILVTGLIPISQSAFAADDKNTGNNNENDKNKHDFTAHTVLVGDGLPPNELGKVGDLYIDDTTPNLTLYEKVAGDKWNVIGSFSGPAGPAGTQGPAGPAGTQGPAGTITAQSCPSGQAVTGIDSNGNLICSTISTGGTGTGSTGGTGTGSTGGDGTGSTGGTGTGSTGGDGTGSTGGDGTGSTGGDGTGSTGGDGTGSTGGDGTGSTGGDGTGSTGGDGTGSTGGDGTGSTPSPSPSPPATP